MIPLKSLAVLLVVSAFVAAVLAAPSPIQNGDPCIPGTLHCCCDDTHTSCYYDSDYNAPSQPQAGPGSNTPAPAVVAKNDGPSQPQAVPGSNTPGPAVAAKKDHSTMTSPGLWTT